MNDGGLYDMFGLSHDGGTVMIALNFLHDGFAVGDVAGVTVVGVDSHVAVLMAFSVIVVVIVRVATLVTAAGASASTAESAAVTVLVSMLVLNVFFDSDDGGFIAVADLLDRGLVSVADLLLDNGLLNVSVLVGMVAGVTVVHVREHGIVLVRFAVSIVMLMPEITDKAATGASFSTAHGAAVIVLMRVCGLLNVTNLVGFSVGVALARGAGAVS